MRRLKPIQSFLTVPKFNQTWFFSISLAFPLKPTGWSFFNQHEGTSGRPRNPWPPLKKFTWTLSPECRKDEPLNKTNECATDNNKNKKHSSLWTIILNSNFTDYSRLNGTNFLSCPGAVLLAELLSGETVAVSTSHRLLSLFHLSESGGSEVR